MWKGKCPSKISLDRVRKLGEGVGGENTFRLILITTKYTKQNLIKIDSVVSEVWYHKHPWFLYIRYVHIEYVLNDYFLKAE